MSPECGFQASTNLTKSEGMDISLQILYYDFSATEDDFDYATKTLKTTPTYVDSPFPAWLRESDVPSNDTFSDWFRNVDNNYVFETNIVIPWLNTSSIYDPINRYWSESFFPLDGLGYAAEHQRDCSYVLHNFGFTSAIRTGMHFTGREEIAVGGGEEIFVYVNKILVLQVQREYQSVTTCKKVSLANANAQELPRPQVEAQLAAYYVRPPCTQSVARPWHLLDLTGILNWHSTWPSTWNLTLRPQLGPHLAPHMAPHLGTSLAPQLGTSDFVGTHWRALSR
eukprot:XP_011663473.1 PREDICTED: uncharacterized protein LOC105437956 [Strongylocentrotus purpuratus]